MKKRVKRAEAESGKYVKSVPEGAVVRGEGADARSPGRGGAVGGPPSGAKSQ